MEEIKVEIWKDIKDFPNYQISNFGRVKSKERITNVGIKNVKEIKREERILKLFHNKKGYTQTILYRDKKPYPVKIHRLVANAFIPNPENKPQVNHIDGDKNNNRIDNLEWCTQSENNKHAWKQGLKTATKKHSNASKENGEKYRSIKINQYDLQGKYIKTWNSVREAERTLKMYGISQCCKGKCKTIGGYIWKYRSDTNAN